MAFPWIPLVFAAFDWGAVAGGRSSLGQVTRPAVIIALSVWILVTINRLTLPIVLVLVGLAFALADDVLRMPTLDRFRPAWIAFSIMLLAYIAALNTSLPPLNFSTALIAAFVLLPFTRIYRRILNRMKATERDSLRGPMLVYAAMLAVMLISGLATFARLEWSPAASLFAATGTVMLAASEIVLLWDRFVEKIAQSNLKIRVAYHLGQALFAAGMVLQFGAL